MAYTEQTTHYGLPLPTAGDKSTFLDTNESFERVDSALYGAATDASAAYNKSIEIALESHELKRSVIDLGDKINAMRADVNLNTTNIVATMEDVDTLQTDTNKLKLDVNDLIVSELPEIDEKIKKKIDTFSGEVTDADDEQYTAKTTDAIAYDETNGQLLLKVDGADTVIPFSKKSNDYQEYFAFLGRATTAQAQGAIEWALCNGEQLVLPTSQSVDTSKSNLVEFISFASMNITVKAKVDLLHYTTATNPQVHLKGEEFTCDTYAGGTYYSIHLFTPRILD